MPNSASDDFEAATSVWTVTGTAGTVPDVVQWRRQQITPLDHHFSGIDSNVITDEALASPPLQVGSGIFSFTFSQSYSFDFQSGVNGQFFDGGVIEVSLDGGATWADITAPPFTAALSSAYDEILAAGRGNPLSGRNAYAAFRRGHPILQPVLAERAGQPI